MYLLDKRHNNVLVLYLFNDPSLIDTACPLTASFRRRCADPLRAYNIIPIVIFVIFLFLAFFVFRFAQASYRLQSQAISHHVTKGLQ